MRYFYVYIFLIVFILLGCKSKIGQLQINSEQAHKPNIVLINIDDLGWRDLGYMGSQFYETPNIDRLAAEGMIFNHAYASAANCAPSRAGLMTGQWSTRHQIYTVGNSDRGKSKNRRIIPIKNTTTLSDDFHILPEMLQENGYGTCTAGKWHLSDDPLEYGFDINIGGNHKGNPGSYYPPYKNVDLEVEDDPYLTDNIMNRTIRFIESVNEPFFLYYTPYAVHTPLHPVDSLKYKYENKETWNAQFNIDYATMIDNLDRNIGRLIQTLEDKGVFDDTILILTSDNGGIYGVTYQTPLRDGKGSYYEGGIRVPFLCRWPGEIVAGSSSDTPITNLDIYPTIMDLLQIENNAVDFDGESILSELRGGPGLAERILIWHFPIYLQAYNKAHNQSRDSLFRTRPGTVVRKGDWKLHYYYEDKGLELYNLSDDQSEMNNLAQSHSEILHDMKSAMDYWFVETNAPIPTEKNPEFVEVKK